MDNGPFIEDLPIKMVVFKSYVNLPEGISCLFEDWHPIFRTAQK